MRNRIAVTLVIVALLIGIAMAGAIGWFVYTSRSRPQFANTPTIVQQIQSLSELVTVKYMLEKVVVYDDPKFFADLIPLGENRVVLLAHGVVKAGVDLGRLRPEDVQVSGTAIRLSLPPATLTDAYLDEKQTQVIDRQTGLLRTFDKDLEKTTRQFALAEIHRAARAGGIEREANQRAREQLTNFLRTLGYTEVQVSTRGAK